MYLAGDRYDLPQLRQMAVVKFRALSLDITLSSESGGTDDLAQAAKLALDASIMNRCPRSSWTSYLTSGFSYGRPRGDEARGEHVEQQRHGDRGTKSLDLKTSSGHRKTECPTAKSCKERFAATMKAGSTATALTVQKLSPRKSARRDIECTGLRGLTP